MRNSTLRHKHFRNRFAGIGPHFHCWVEDPATAAYQWFRQEHRVIDKRRDRKIISMPDPMIRKGRLGASRYAIAPEVGGLQVGRGY